MFLEISQNSQEKKPMPECLFDKVAGFRPTTLLKISLRHRCFPVNFAKFLRISFFPEHLWETASVYLKDCKIISFPNFFFFDEARSTCLNGFCLIK